jgi:hypothetical protein
MKDGRPFTFAGALGKTGKIPNLESGCAPARLSRIFPSLWKISLKNGRLFRTDIRSTR